jgi:hypothetical protein
MINKYIKILFSITPIFNILVLDCKAFEYKFEYKNVNYLEADDKYQYHKNYAKQNIDINNLNDPDIQKLKAAIAALNHSNIDTDTTKPDDPNFTKFWQ